MRDLGKYRGKRKDGGGWVYGSLFKGDLTWIIQIPFKFIEVILETVGEYTGLKDCKRTEKFPEGQEIYEGDLLLTPHEPCSMVAWCNCGWMPFLRDQQTEPRFYLGRDVEVIGNIHENESPGKSC